MAANTMSLWPAAIRATVQSPQSILLAQAEALTEQTTGVLVGEVKAGFADDDLALLYLNIRVPDLNDYRHRVLVVQSKAGMHYPASIDADIFRGDGLPLQLVPKLTSPKPENRADTDKEFIALVEKVFNSPYVVSVAQSLIARVTEIREGKQVELVKPKEHLAEDAFTENV